MLTLAEYAVGVVITLDGAIILGTIWAHENVNIDELIDTAEVIHSLPIARLKHVASYQKIAGRPKDLKHLRLMDVAMQEARRNGSRT